MAVARARLSQGGQRQRRRLISRPSEQDVRIATAKREKRVATLDEVKRVLALMPSATVIEQRDRALVAFAILSGARDGALATLRLSMWT